MIIGPLVFSAPAIAAERPSFEREVEPRLNRYCFGERGPFRKVGSETYPGQLGGDVASQAGRGATAIRLRIECLLLTWAACEEQQGHRPVTDVGLKLRLYREVSPVSYLKANSPRLLMIQGDKDTTIPVHHAYYMKQRAAAIDAPVDIVIVANAGHNWVNVEADIMPTRDESIEKTVALLKRRLDQYSKK